MSRKKIIRAFISMLFILVILFFCLDYYLNFDGFEFLGTKKIEIKISAFLLFLIILYSSFGKEASKKTNKLTRLGFVLSTAAFLTLNFVRGFSNYEEGIYEFRNYRYEKIMTTYKNTECGNMRSKFKKDLFFGNIKYFISGGHYNGKFVKNLDIEVYSNGTPDMFIGIGKNRECYNELVEKYFLDKKGIDISKELRKYENIDELIW